MFRHAIHCEDDAHIIDQIASIEYFRGKWGLNDDFFAGFDK